MRKNVRKNFKITILQDAFQKKTLSCIGGVHDHKGNTWAKTAGLDMAFLTQEGPGLEHFTAT